MIADLPASGDAPLRVWAALGTPCTGVFLPVAVVRDAAGALGARTAHDPVAVVPGVLGVLGDAEAWRCFAALRRRVEAPGDQRSAALTAIRAVLAPVEADAWDEADALWAANASPDAWNTASSGWDRAVQAALASLT